MRDGNDGVRSLTICRPDAPENDDDDDDVESRNNG